MVLDFKTQNTLTPPYDVHMPAIDGLYWLLILCVMIDTAGGDSLSSSPLLPTRSNFLRAAVQGGRRQRYLWCSDDPSVCLDREKNPWGGNTCCFRRFCKDTSNDPDHCGDCGHRCTYGMWCCGGRCVDVQNDSNHCGSCFQTCTGPGCHFAMCDYGGG